MVDEFERVELKPFNSVAGKKARSKFIVAFLISWIALDILLIS